MSDEQDALREALKRTAVTLKEADVPFALGGGYAAWARGGPEPEHDVDFVVAEEDADQAERVLCEAGLRVEHPPEDWLFKVYTDDAMVDVLFRIGGDAVERSLLERATETEVLSVRMPVLAATDVLLSKLKALDEHDCDLGKVVPAARALREQVDWSYLRQQRGDDPFGATALYLLDRLGITDQSPEDS